MDYTTAMRAWLFIAFFCLSAPAAEPRQVYWLPMVPGGDGASVPTSFPAARERQILIWNQFDEGHYGAHLIELKEGKDGRFRRSASRRVSTLRGWHPDSCQEALGLLLTNSVMKRIDSTAFQDMDRKGYFPKDEGAFEHHIDSSHDFDANQMVYFETTSWHTAEEAKALFGGRIPWDRVVEAEAPGGLSLEGLHQLVNDGPPDVRLRLRWSTLRLVAGQYLRMPPAVAGHPYVISHLPWQEDEKLAARHAVDRGRTPFVFELGRAAQVPGLFEEAELLVRVAAAVAVHTTDLFQQLGSFQPMPTSAVGIYALSLDRGHTALFQRRLGMKVAASDGNRALLLTTLQELLDKQRPDSVLAGAADIHGAVPERYSPEGAVRVLARYRGTFRRDWDLTSATQRLTVNGPVVLRDHSPGFDFSVRSIVAPRWKPITDEAYRGLEQALDRQGQLHSPTPFAYYEQDTGDQDWPGLHGKRPLVVSNLSPAELEKDPRYVEHLLGAIAGRWSSRVLPPEVAEAMEVLLATPNDAVARAAEAAGMRRLTGTHRGHALVIPLRQLHTRPVGAYSIGPGYWERYRLLFDLPGV